MALTNSAKYFQLKSKIITDQTNNESITRIKRDLNGIKNSQEKIYGNGGLVKSSPVYEKTKKGNFLLKIVTVSEKNEKNEKKNHGNFLLRITKVRITEKGQEEIRVVVKKVVVVEKEKEEEEEI